MREWILVGLMVAVGSAFAASPYKQSLTLKKNQYLRDGVFIGGKANGGSSLLGMRRAYSPKMQLERVIVDLGDRKAHPAGKDLGYFQVHMDARNQRAVMDLAQLMVSKVSERQVQQMFEKSPFVKSVELTLDPEDKGATLVLHFKRPMKLEVFQILKSGKPARVVMDFVLDGSTAVQSSSAVKSSG